jgi:hypothetical protein
MVITYFPAFTVFSFIVIVKPGPTVPVSVPVLTAPNVELASASIARAVARAAVISRIGAPFLAEGERAVCHHNSLAARLGSGHRDKPQIVIPATR